MGPGICREDVCTTLQTCASAFLPLPERCKSGDLHTLLVLQGGSTPPVSPEASPESESPPPPSSNVGE